MTHKTVSTGNKKSKETKMIFSTFLAVFGQSFVTIFGQIWLKMQNMDKFIEFAKSKNAIEKRDQK